MHLQAGGDSSSCCGASMGDRGSFSFNEAGCLILKTKTGIGYFNEDEFLASMQFLQQAILQ